MQLRLDVGAVVFFTIIFTDCVVAHDYVAYLLWTFKLNLYYLLIVTLLFYQINRAFLVYALSFYSSQNVLRVGPNFLSQPKNLFTYCASPKHLVPDRNLICIQ